MPLSILDRFLLAAILPTTGAIGDLRLTQQLLARLRLSPEEHARHIKQEDKHLRIVNGLVTQPFELSEAEHALIAGRLEALSEAKRLRRQYLDLYERFVGAA